MDPQAQRPVSFFAMMIDTPKTETLKLIYWQLALVVELPSEFQLLCQRTNHAVVPRPPRRRRMFKVLLPNKFACIRAGHVEALAKEEDSPRRARTDGALAIADFSL